MGAGDDPWRATPAPVPPTVRAVVRDQRAFLVVAIAAGVTLLVSGWRGAAATWITMGALWGAGALGAAWRSRTGDRAWLVARVGVQNVALQLFVALPGIARGLLRFGREAPSEIGTAFVSNALVTVVALPVLSAVVLTCAALVVAVPVHLLLRRLLVVSSILICVLPGVPASGAAPTCAVDARVELDHVPVVVADLEAAGDLFATLGFTLKPGRPHANGLRNLHAKFGDRREIELITSSREADELARHYLTLLEQGPGPAFLAFHAGSTADVVAGLGPTATAARRAGSLVSFPPGHRWGHLFFGQLNASPTDEPHHFEHPNGAVTLEAVWLAAGLEPERELLEPFGVRSCNPVMLPSIGEAAVLGLRGGALYGVPVDPVYPGRRLVGLTVRVTDLEPAAGRAAEAGLTAVRGAVGSRSSLVLDLRARLGLWIEFRGPGDADRSPSPGAGAGVSEHHEPIVDPRSDGVRTGALPSSDG